MDLKLCWEASSLPSRRRAAPAPSPRRRETVASVPRYDFNGQLTYALEKPRQIPTGTWVMLTGGFDNSPRNPANPDPKKTVHWGEQSWEEMFLGWYNVTWDPPKVAKQTAAASAGGQP